jgi:arylsulfatase
VSFVPAAGFVRLPSEAVRAPAPAIPVSPFALAAGLALAMLAACGAADGPRWIALAAVPVAARTGPAAAPSDGGPRLLQEEGEQWIATELARVDWHAMERPGRWRARPPLRSPGRGMSALACLSSGARAFEQQRSGQDGEAPGTPGTFALIGDWLVLQLAPDEEPPATTTLALHSAREPRASGVARVNGRRFSGSGFSVWPGERLELVLDVPPESELRVALCAEALLARPEERSFRFRILLDGAALLEQALAEARDGVSARREVALPAAGARAARLAFEVAGPLGMTAFLEPLIVPRAAAEPRAAPRRPDLVLFLADTFRADNLALAGGPPGLTPNLDALARESRCYTQARSVATHTAPAHASLFTGQYPTRLSVDLFGHSLPEEVVTIAEELARAGYRTGAVTDSVIVSRSFGLSQGFDWFDELRAGMASTHERVLSFLEHGDGRPTFLFVHTYRVHSPYVSSAATRARLASVLGPDPPGETAALGDELMTIARAAADGRQGIDARARELAGRYELRYRAGVAEFDQELGQLLAEPAVRALVDGGFLVFTSDHGEAFLEHDEVHHAGRVFEEQIRIPLLLRGPGIEPGVSAEPVSLVDVTPTLADLAGLAPGSSWQGRSLRGAGGSGRFLYAFECNEYRPSSVTVVAAEKKLIGLLDQRARELLGPYAAFDLARDPREGTDLLASGEPWPAELYEHLSAHRVELVEPLVERTPALLDAEQRDDLEALGYGGR